MAVVAAFSDHIPAMLHTPTPPRGPAFRPSPAFVAVGSIVVAALLVAGLYWHATASSRGFEGPPLIAYCAASLRPPMEAAAREYEAETGRRVQLQFGASEEMLHQVASPIPADLFLPADESYVQQARTLGLIDREFPLATMRAVVLTSRGNPKGVAQWTDLTRADVRVSLANPMAAIGKLVRLRLIADGKWEALAPRVVGSGTVVDSANATKVGGVDVAIVWDVVAVRYVGGPEPRQVVLSLPELADVTARVAAATLNQSRDRAEARRFARFLASPRGLTHFRIAGFTVEAPK